MDIKLAAITVFALVLSNSAKASTIVINEFLPNAVGTDGGNEWIELYNNSTNFIDIGGWKIQKASSSYTSVFTFPTGTSVSSGGYLVIGGANVTSANLNTTQLKLGNAASTGDAVRLLDDLTNVIDTVIYGPNNNDGFLNDFGSIALNFAAKPLAGQSLARIFDGLDTQISGNDFIIRDNTTAGASNSVSAVPIPAAVWLFGSGLIGLVGIARSKKDS